LKPLVILLFLLIPQMSLAVTFLDKGSPAPYKGYLFSEDEELQLRANDEKLLKLEQLQIKYDALNEIQTERIDNLRKGLESEIKKNEYNQYWVYAGFFLGGLTMYYAVKAAGSLK
jgi:hypothetical protein